MSTALKAVPQLEFLKCFRQWQHRWAKCIAAKGECCEGDPCKYAGMLAVRIIPGIS